MKPLDAMHVDLDGTRLIEASAGTGKTFTITTLYLRLVIESELPVGEILVVTFTKAATAELRGRIRDRLREAVDVFEARLGGERLEERGEDSILAKLIAAAEAEDRLEAGYRLLRAALRGFDEAAIYTIHGFCKRVLQENAFESGVRFDPEFDVDPRALFDEVAADFWTERLYAAPQDLVAYIRAARVGKSAAGPSLLSELASKAVAEPGMPILPESLPALADLERVRDAFMSAHARAAAMWSSRAGEITDLLVNADGLNRNSYAVASLQGKWPGILDALFADPARLAKEQVSIVEKYSTHTIQGKMNKGKQAPVDPFFDLCADLVQANSVYEAELAAHFVAFEIELCGYARDEIARRKAARNSLSFDDLMHALAGALSERDGEQLAEQVRGRYKAALIDEFQDTDVDQYTIFRRIWHDAERTLFLIGDPKQAIYGFRGADVFAYMLAKQDAGENAYTLTENWRSDPGLIASVNALFEGLAQPFIFEGIGFDPVKPAPGASDRMRCDGSVVTPFRLLHQPRSGDTIKSRKVPKPLSKEDARDAFHPAIADDIARVLTNGTQIEDRPIGAGDIAVLCRTRFEIALIRELLSARGIPSVVHGGANVFESDEALWLERLLAAIAEPTSLGALRAALTTPLIGISGPALAEIDAEPTGWDPWLLRFQEWRAIGQRLGPIQLIDRLTARCGTRRRLLERPDGERRLTNLLHLAELLQEAAGQAGFGPHGLASWLARMRTDERARTDSFGEGALLRLESDAKAVQLVTIHGSKGLQYSVVYCTDLWDGDLLRGKAEAWVRFHDPHDGRALKLDLGSQDLDANRGAAEVEALAEQMRIAYVALTRAKHQVVCAWGAVKSAETSALGLLLHPSAPAGPDSSIEDPGFVAERRTYFESRDDADLSADLDALVARSDGRIGVEAPVQLGSPSFSPDSADPDSLAVRSFRRRLDSAWRTSSFSGLVAPGVDAANPAAGARGSEHPSQEGRDYDGDTAVLVPAPPEVVEAETSVRLARFPAGAGPGTMIHDVFEHIDFEAGDDAETRRCVERALLRHGMPAALESDLRAGIQDVLSTPLGGDAGALTLRAVPKTRRLDEMEFLLPAAHAGTRIRASDLADTLRSEATHPVVVDYAERVGALRFQPLQGFLRGFIDLTFAHAGRFYVVDYKSNRLGEVASDYAPERLGLAMQEHDYVLQYHLYCVALHRYLAKRLPDYSYAEHFGGVYYLFLRGMAPGHAPGSGIFHDRPSEALIAGLSAHFGGMDSDVAGAGEAA